ncbi:MAG TPA: HD domain-containing phosphohydrolase [Pyrinomonadaceae bacterium]|jgi:HD-GYP domain-containing protein (c-di-GMP phosphodiesterase class II)
MHPFVPLCRTQTAAGRHAVQTLLSAAAALGREEQPRLYRHVHPHGHATARLARSFAAAIGCGGAPTLDEIEAGAHLHDFGKYLIAESILLKPGPLNESERAAVAYHPVYGAHLLTSLPAVTEAVRQVVLYHHERWDGHGYPDGLKGTRIPLAARIVAVADVYTSLRARRSYKPTLTRGEAAAEMERMAGRELDPDMTRDFLRLVGAY